ncbi:hypothetical protein Fot_09230 [Forsythia ovata]|uniref:Uncharacterized protein n=1 Tax=Forsythia ovata TaxID=205694 RepID=A0ABD1WH47_9LAMI
MVEYVEFFFMDMIMYLSIVRHEGLEISQPALDPSKSKVHHRITVRMRGSKVHRRYYNGGKCNDNSTGPPCVGWVEMMAPVYSKAAWRCAWYMIQSISDQPLQSKNSSSETSVDSVVEKIDIRYEIRKQSYIEMSIFKKRWNRAVAEDECWVDPFRQPADQKIQ